VSVGSALPHELPDSGTGFRPPLRYSPTQSASIPQVICPAFIAEFATPNSHLPLKKLKPKSLQIILPI
jgi:hypothetical protein